MQNVGLNQCTVIPLDDVLKAWGMAERLNYLTLCKKYGGGATAANADKLAQK